MSPCSQELSNNQERCKKRIAEKRQAIKTHEARTSAHVTGMNEIMGEPRLKARDKAKARIHNGTIGSSMGTWLQEG